LDNDDETNSYYIIREVVYDKEAKLYYFIKPKSNYRILDINVSKPTNYDESELKKKITGAMNKAPSGASAASASKALSRKLSRTASSEELAELEAELEQEQEGIKFNANAAKEHFSEAYSQARNAMSASESKMAELKKTEANFKQTVNVARIMTKLITNKQEKSGKISRYKALLREKKTDKKTIQKITQKIETLKAEVASIDAQIEALKQQSGLKGGSTHKKNYQKRKHHRSKHTVKSK
jgi:hypothetical protein